MNKFQRFLSKNNIEPCGDLPLVHTTAAYNVEKIMESKELSPRACNVFLGENLNYFFYGKPSYKINSGSIESSEWQMPVCFVVKFDSISNIKRMYPFDTGAFINKRHPEYITMMGLGEFDSGISRGTPSRIVGAFFSDVKKFFRMEPKGKEKMIEEFSLGIRDAEVLALQRLALERSNNNIDDRRFCIEIQTEDKVSLLGGNTMAVIIPNEYLEDDEIRNFITNDMNAVPISYNITSMSSESMTSVIYEKLIEFYKLENII